MGKKLKILGFLASLFVFVFSTNAFAIDDTAPGYTCEVQYTECGNIKSRIRQGVERSLCVADRREVDLKEQECKACKKE